jgi:hypothetical protein
VSLDFLGYFIAAFYIPSLFHWNPVMIIMQLLRVQRMLKYSNNGLTEDPRKHIRSAGRERERGEWITRWEEEKKEA